MLFLLIAGLLHATLLGGHLASASSRIASARVDAATRRRAILLALLRTRSNWAWTSPAGNFPRPGAGGESVSRFRYWTRTLIGDTGI
jgi:hypothetical protein